jgi:hypothetical protein
MGSAIVVGAFTLGGVLMGFVGTLSLENLRLRRQRKGYLRALASELQQNEVAALGVRHSGQLTVMDFSDSTWRAAQFEVAQFLEYRLYEDISLVYTSMAGIRRLAPGGSLAHANDARGEEIMDSWIADTKDARIRLLDLPQLREFRANFERDWQGDSG